MRSYLSLFHQYSGSILGTWTSKSDITHTNFIVFLKKLKTLSSISQIDLNILSSMVDTFDYGINVLIDSLFKLKNSNKISNHIKWFYYRLCFIFQLPSIFSLWLISFFLIIYLKQVESKIRSRKSIDHSYWMTIVKSLFGKRSWENSTSVAEVFYINVKHHSVKQKLS